MNKLLIAVVLCAAPSSIAGDMWWPSVTLESSWCAYEFTVDIADTTPRLVHEYARPLTSMVGERVCPLGREAAKVSVSTCMPRLDELAAIRKLYESEDRWFTELGPIKRAKKYDAILMLRPSVDDAGSLTWTCANRAYKFSSAARWMAPPKAVGNGLRFWDSKIRVDEDMENAVFRLAAGRPFVARPHRAVRVERAFQRGDRIRRAEEQQRATEAAVPLPMPNLVVPFLRRPRCLSALHVVIACNR